MTGVGCEERDIAYLFKVASQYTCGIGRAHGFTEGGVDTHTYILHVQTGV